VTGDVKESFENDEKKEMQKNKRALIKRES